MPLFSASLVCGGKLLFLISVSETAAKMNGDDMAPNSSALYLQVSMGEFGYRELAG